MDTVSESIIEYIQLEILKTPERFNDDINLTELEEEIMDELDIEDEEWEEGDYSFFIYTYLYEEGYLND